MRIFNQATTGYGQIIEAEPAYHLVKSSFRKRPYRLALPYIFYDVRRWKGWGSQKWYLARIGMGTEPLTERSITKVASAPLPNCYPEGNLCLGDEGSMTDSAFSAINLFWMRGFNEELTDFTYHPVYQDLKRRTVGRKGARSVFSYWERKFTPESILTLPWEPQRVPGKYGDDTRYYLSIGTGLKVVTEDLPDKASA